MKKEAQPAAEAPKPKKLKPIYKLRDVVKKLYRWRIEDKIPYKSTEPEYLGRYQKAVSDVLDDMTEEELEEAETLLEQWNKEGGPSDLQLK